MSDIGGVAADHLKSYIQRIERLEEDKKNIAEDIKQVFAEAKAVGFDVPTMKKIIRLRKMDASDRQEQEHMLDLYKSAIGMDSFDNTPLGMAAE